jgi:hypothetical protein
MSSELEQARGPHPLKEEIGFLHLPLSVTFKGNEGPYGLIVKGAETSALKSPTF